jgi:hypothetical protein
MCVLIAEIGKTGIERVYASVTSVSDGTLAAEVFEAAGLGLRLTHDSIRQHFEGKVVAQSATPLPQGETDIFVCLCGERLLSTGAAIRHVEKDHASAKIRRDIDKLEDVIEGMIFPNPLPAAPEPTVIIKDRTFRAELIKELATVFTDLKIGDEKAAIDLVEYCEWGQVAGLNYDEVKVRIIDGVVGKKIQPPMHEIYLTAMALFLSQVGRLSKKYGS